MVSYSLTVDYIINSSVPGNENLTVNDSFCFWLVDRHVS